MHSKTHEYGEGQTRTYLCWTQKGYPSIHDQLDILPVTERQDDDEGNR